MTSQPSFAAEFPDEILAADLRNLLEEAAPLFLDMLFEDLRTIVEAIEHTSVVSLLPRAYRAWYSPLFVRGLLVCAVRIVQALGEGSGAEPTCTAEELLWHFLLGTAVVAWEIEGPRPDDLSDRAAEAEEFEDFIYQDTDWKLLYQSSESDRETMARMPCGLQDIVQPVESWFEAFNGPDAQPNPYCRDLIPRPVDLITGNPL
jgi:hypothetical protein